MMLLKYVYIEYYKNGKNSSYLLNISRSINECYEYSYSNLFDIYELLIDVIKNEDIDKKYKKLQITDNEQIHSSIRLITDSGGLLYKVSINNRKIESESLYTINEKDQELIINIDKLSSPIPNIGNYWWKWISNEDPEITYGSEKSILFQPKLLYIYDKITNIYNLSDIKRESVINLLKSDERLFSEFKHIFYSLFPDTKKITDNLEFITSLGKLSGDDLSLEGSGFNRVIDILPYIIHSYLYGSTILIPYLNQSLHPKLLNYIKDIYLKLNNVANDHRVTGNGCIITYLEGYE